MMRASYIAPDLFSPAPAVWPFGSLTPQAYEFLMVDPPWRFENYSEAGQAKGPEPHYRTMSDDEMLALPVADLAREDCALWLWATAPKLDLAFAVLSAWGFGYVTFGAWDKGRWGTGYVLRSLCEPYLIAKRGSPKIDGRAVPNLIRETRREHSRKPDLAYRHAEQMMPHARRAELFSRQTRPGWEVWGHEAGKFDEEHDQ